MRLDSHLYDGYSISHHYDSLIAKLIVHAKDRKSAIARMRKALQEYYIEGIKTTIPFHLKVLQNPAFLKGVYSTRFIEEEFNSKKNILISDSFKDNSFLVEDYIRAAHGCLDEIH